MNSHIRTVLAPAVVCCLTALVLSFNPVVADEQGNALKSMIATKNAIKAGRAKAQSCTRCHGRDGVHQLALRAGWKDSDGQFAIVKLRAFRDGQESHVVMSAVASTLSDQDIEQIALWLDSIAAKR